MPEWKDYGLNFSNGKVPEDAGELKTVHHIVHVQICRRILEDRKLRAGIIGDESILRTSRISVVWLSANYWHNGSIYGSVRFSFDWKTIARDRNIYWVEARRYNNPAYRFLITSRDLSGDKRLQSYDPETDIGPLRKKRGVWYWNRKCTSEFMVDQDISLSDVVSFDFVSHAKCRDSLNCKEEKYGYQTTGGQVMSFVLGNGAHCLDKVLIEGKDLTFVARGALNSIYRALRPKGGRFNGVLRRRASIGAVIRGALALHGSGQRLEAMELISTIRDENTFEKGLERVVSKHFDFPNWEFDD